MPQRRYIYGSLLFSAVFISLIIQSYTNPVQNHDMAETNRSKRSFIDLQCNGTYDKSTFAKVDTICEDCYNLFREPRLLAVCRQKCFTSDYFKGCVDIQRLSDEFDRIQKWVRKLNGLGL